jgi:RNA-directed DNA polymerase
LSNLIARGLDSRLTGIATKLGWTYTRYADDATFSTPTPDEEHVGYLLARIRHIADDEGFRVNEQKTRVLRRNASQRVTGLVVNDGVHVPRATRRRLRAILHQAKQTGLASQNRRQHPRFAEWVHGMVAYIAMVNAGHARKPRGERNAEGEP